LDPINIIDTRIQSLQSLAHIAQAEGEALRAHDAAVARIEAFAAKPASQEKTVVVTGGGHPGGWVKIPTPPPIKKQRVVKPSEIVKTAYLESTEDVDGFLAALRRELETAIKNNERIQIR
jgi:hypothetical protein